MKKIIFALIAMATIATVQAQFIASPATYPLFTGTSAILIAGSSTSNLPPTLARLVPVGANGIAFVFGCGATNAADTTNSTAIVELVDIDSRNNLTNVTDNQTYTLGVSVNGTTRSDFRTNLVSTTANLGNAQFARIRSFQNTNLNSVWISNAFVNVR